MTSEPAGSYQQRGSDEIRLCVLYRVSLWECVQIRENVRYKQKRLYPMVNSSGDSGGIQMWSPCGPTYCTHWT